MKASKPSSFTAGAASRGQLSMRMVIGNGLNGGSKVSSAPAQAMPITSEAGFNDGISLNSSPPSTLGSSPSSTLTSTSLNSSLNTGLNCSQRIGTSSSTVSSKSSACSDHEYELIKEVCGEEATQMLISSKHQEREEFMNMIIVWIQQSSNLPHGFMLFPSASLPIEKTKVLKAISIVLRMTISDKIIKIVKLAYTACTCLVESSPVQQTKNIIYLKEGLSYILPVLMEKVIDSNDRNRINAVSTLVKMSSVKIISELIVHYALLPLSYNGKPLTQKGIQGRLSLIESLVNKHGLKTGNTAVFGVSQALIDILNEGLGNKTPAVKDSCIETMAVIYRALGKEAFDAEFLERLQSKSSALVQKLEAKVRAKRQEDQEEEKRKEELKKKQQHEEAHVEFKDGDITREFIMRKSLKRPGPNDTFRGWLKTLTHLHFDSCDISAICNLEYCTNLRVLYLYENNITKIEGLQNNKNLTQLHLQHNFIEKIEGLENLVQLRKLYLGNNKISCLEGLDTLTCLEELSLDNQDISIPLTINEATVKCLASLEVLSLAGNLINDARNVGYLGTLVDLDLSKNNVEQIDHLIFILENNRQLNSLNVANNPICESKKMRDQLILASSPELRLLNNIEVTDIQREFIISLDKEKSKRLTYPIHDPALKSANKSSGIDLNGLLIINQTMESR